MGRRDRERALALSWALARRWLQFGVAVVTAASGAGAMITAGVGVSPWDVFSTGLASTAGITVGTSTILLLTPQHPPHSACC